MNRITISLTKEIEEYLRIIQGGLIQNRKEDVSFTTIINLILLSGIFSSNYVSENNWKHLKDFMKGKKINLDLKQQIHVFINKLILD